MKNKVEVVEPAITCEVLSGWASKAELGGSKVLEVDLLVDGGRGRRMQPLWKSTALSAGMHGGDDGRGDVVFDLAAGPERDHRDRAVHEGPTIALEESALTLNDLLNLMTDGAGEANQSRIRFVERGNDDAEPMYEDLGWLRASQVQRVSRGVAYVLLSPRAPTLRRGVGVDGVESS